MARHRVCLEVAEDGSTMAILPDLPGCFSRAATKEEALAKLHDRIREYLDFLKKFGEDISLEMYEAEFEVVEVANTRAIIRKGDSVAIFRSDLEPVSDEELERYLKLIDYSRKELLRLLAKAPKEAYDWRPDQTSSRSIRNAAQHIASVEGWYLSRLRDTSDLSRFLRENREGVVKELRSLPSEEWSHVFVHEQRAGFPPENWTFRKVLRRLVWHEHLHIRQIARLLAKFENSHTR